MPPAPPARQRPPAADPSDNTQQRQHDAPAAVHSASTARQTQRTGMQEKRLVALSSVLAAVGLTTFKLVVGLFSGSLGILAEAAHSALDLVAALMTLVAVRVADRPPDETHNYGHAKFENLSAFLEAGLLLLTAAWIIYEAAQRLLFHGGQVDANIWTFLVMGVSIAVDARRWRPTRCTFAPTSGVRWWSFWAWERCGWARQSMCPGWVGLMRWQRWASR